MPQAAYLPVLLVALTGLEAQPVNHTPLGGRCHCPHRNAQLLEGHCALICHSPSNRVNSR
jgi:hypothetical protein